MPFRTQELQKNCMTMTTSTIINALSITIETNFFVVIHPGSGGNNVIAIVFCVGLHSEAAFALVIDEESGTFRGGPASENRIIMNFILECLVLMDQARIFSHLIS